MLIHSTFRILSDDKQLSVNNLYYLNHNRRHLEVQRHFLEHLRHGPKIVMTIDVCPCDGGH